MTAVPDGITIVRTDEDLGPATKILPAAKARRGQEVEILYVDDDRVYPSYWSTRSLALRKAHPQTAICSAGFQIQRYKAYTHKGAELPRAVLAPQARKNFDFQLRRLLATLRGQKRWVGILAEECRKFDKTGYVDVAEGFDGVMVKPDYIDEAAFVIPPVVWAVDDIWLPGMLMRRGFRSGRQRSFWGGRKILEASRHFALHAALIEGNNQEAANRACIDYLRETYEIWGE